MLAGGPQLLNAYGSLVVVQRHSSQSRVEHAPHYRVPAAAAAAAAVANDRDRYNILIIVVVRSRGGSAGKKGLYTTHVSHSFRPMIRNINYDKQRCTHACVIIIWLSMSQKCTHLSVCET